MQSTAGVPRPALVVAIALGALLAVGVATVGIVGKVAEHQRHVAAEAARDARRSGPLALAPVPAPEATSPQCTAVLEALPRDLVIDGQRVPRRELAQPAPPGTAAWGDAGHDPLTLRCGMDAPAELTPSSPLVEISGVGWLRISAVGQTSWLAVDRPVHVALTVPRNSGSGPVQDLSELLRRTLPKQDVFP